MQPKVTFGIVNCNRLFYLKSCIESLFETTAEYSNKQFIVVDNASVEPGTKDYLDELEKKGVEIVRQPSRDYSNEFARGLNTIVEKSSGEYVCLLQGDMQFILKNWLNDVIDFYERNSDVVGSVILDAQRRVRLTSNASNILQFSKDRQPSSGKNIFFGDMSRGHVGAAGDVVFKRSVLEQIGPWNEKNVNHEGELDSETDMRERVKKLVESGAIPNYVMAISSVPAAVGIFTDPRGTQGRIRGNRRYGHYWKAKDPSGWKYYELIDTSGFDLTSPNGIEAVARPIGFNNPVDFNGDWLKNPIRPETAAQEDWVEL